MLVRPSASIYPQERALSPMTPHQLAPQALSSLKCRAISAGPLSVSNNPSFPWRQVHPIAHHAPPPHADRLSRETAVGFLVPPSYIRVVEANGYPEVVCHFK